MNQETRKFISWFLMELVVIGLTITCTGYYFRSAEQGRARDNYYSRLHKLYDLSMYMVSEQELFKKSEAERHKEVRLAVKEWTKDDTYFNRLSFQERNAVMDTALYFSDLITEKV